MQLRCKSPGNGSSECFPGKWFLNIGCGPALDDEFFLISEDITCYSNNRHSLIWPSFPNFLYDFDPVDTGTKVNINQDTIELRNRSKTDGCFSVFCYLYNKVFSQV